MKKKILFILLLNAAFTFGQCLNADSLNTTNITYINAQANWTPAPSAHHYLIHYREIGSSNWSNLGNIDSTMTSRNIPQLQPLTTYEWEIKTFCDSTNQPNSGWSISDTFTTTAFVPSAFNPTLVIITGNTICNTNTSFTFVASQIQNEPDIMSTVFSSDKGHFEINTLNSGDTVGNASYTSSFLNFTSKLVVDFTLGPNYAKIDLIDSLGLTMGFFTIENLSDGVKISSLGPNDGNNYTNGYVSQINFYDLFVNPNEEGPITFVSNINSELGDVVSYVDSSIVISCPPTNTSGTIKTERKLVIILDALGRRSDPKNNKIFFYVFSDGTIEKKIKVSQ